MDVDVLTIKTSDKFKGAFGIVTSIAPLPALEKVEFP